MSDPRKGHCRPSCEDDPACRSGCGSYGRELQERVDAAVEALSREGMPSVRNRTARRILTGEARPEDIAAYAAKQRETSSALRECSLCGQVRDTQGRPPRIPTLGGWVAHAECVGTTRHIAASDPWPGPDGKPTRGRP